jgi:hypothetical protein
MAIHYNLTLLYDKFDINSAEIQLEIINFIKEVPMQFKEIETLIVAKNKTDLFEKASELTQILTNFGVIHAHETGDLLIAWSHKKAKKKEAMALYNILLEHYKLARKEMKKDYKPIIEKI